MASLENLTGTLITVHEARLHAHYRTSRDSPDHALLCDMREIPQIHMKLAQRRVNVWKRLQENPNNKIIRHLSLAS